MASLLALIFCLSLGPSFGRRSGPESTDVLARHAHKIASVLRDHVAYAFLNPSVQAELPVIISVKPEFFSRSYDSTEARKAGLKALPLISSYTANLNATQIRLLLESDEVEYVTLDAAITTSATGPTANDIPVATLGGDLTYARGVDGTGTVVALFDSGLGTHADLPSGKIKAAVDFTMGVAVSLPFNMDAYGHGTAVAGIIAGNGLRSAGTHAGVAPGTSFVDIKVVGTDGSGTTSNLIKAIDWLILNKTRYNVKVANFSLGHPPLDSYKVDPLCKAVERLVSAGVVAVVAAGNNGKSSQYPKLWGGINSPANDPAVVTVGAINTRGTVTHKDDIATTYCSRGPTYKDNLFKPDLSAPGNRITSCLKPGSYLQAKYPQYATPDLQYIRLSGSSLAAGFVTGTVAQMFQANPALTPNIVKALLLLSASKLQHPHRFEQGNGLLNNYSAVLLAGAVNMQTQVLPDGAVSPKWILSTPNGPEEVWCGGAFPVGTKILFTQLVNAGAELSWGDGIIWTDSLNLNASAWTHGFLVPGSMFWTPGIIWSEGIVWAEGIVWSEGVIWSDEIAAGDGVIWSDGIVWAESIVWSDHSPEDPN